MPLIQLRNVTLAYGGPPVLNNVQMQVEEGERVCLLGRNGSGKTTLMRLMSGEETPNGGEIIQPPGTRIAWLKQEVPVAIHGQVETVVREGLGAGHHAEEWEIDFRVARLLESMGLDSGAMFEQLSGGLKRRVLLARALITEPNLLLLDEPTNHLDLDAVLWLESFLLAGRCSLFFVTHDRAFLRKLATRILFLDRGNLSSWDCDYATFLERTQAAAEEELVRQGAEDKKLAQEEAWLRQGVKARRTRDQGRVAALKKLRTERAARRERLGASSMQLASGELSGEKVIDVREVSFAYGGGANIVEGLSTTVWRGDRIGILGPNGSGKSTLLKLLLGELRPTVGEVVHGTRLQTVYLDQLRDQVDLEKTLMENVAGSAEQVVFQGRSRHVRGYLQDFLFTTAQATMPAGLLSGGERYRLLLARLFLQPANVLVLDEPTNDLDLETLELLEELLANYAGTLLLVSHDREFLDRVVTATLVFEGGGVVREYVGGYEDWVRQRRSKAVAMDAAGSNAEGGKAGANEKRQRPRKFLNREQRELDALPGRIEILEAELAMLAERLADPALYGEGAEAVEQVRERIAKLEAEAAAAYVRWEELEQLRETLGGGGSG